MIEAAGEAERAMEGARDDVLGIRSWRRVNCDCWDSGR